MSRYMTAPVFVWMIDAGWCIAQVFYPHISKLQRAPGPWNTNEATQYRSLVSQGSGILAK